MECALDDSSESAIQQFYANRSVFITGATGLFGKLLMEKLLRCCPDIARVYILMRPKKGKSVEERLDQLLEKECFGPLKEKFPTFRDKISAVAGDVVQPLCGISDEDFEALRRDVSIVFHSAANTHFTDSLRNAVENNLIGTKHVLELCKKLPLVEVLAHVSTTFVRKEPDCTVPEAVGRCHVEPHEVLSILKILDDDSLEKVTPVILKDVATTYQFSKALSEVLLEDEKEHLPVSIIRPCITGSTWKDPFPGWYDVFQGPSGLFLAAGKGFLRAALAPPHFKLVITPVDVSVNAIIATPWYQVTQGIKGTFVVNCGRKYEDFPVGEDYLELALKLRSVCPISNIYRYPSFTLYYNKWLYYIHASLDHYLPAVIIDALLFVTTGKPFMVRLYRRIEAVLDVYLSEGSSPFYFQLDNFNKVEKAMTPKDAEIFFVNMDTFDIEKFVLDCVLGGRKYLIKDDPSTIPYAIKKCQIWWFVTTVLKWCLILFLIYYMIPQSFLDSTKMHLQSYMYTSEAAFAMPPGETLSSDTPDTSI